MKDRNERKEQTKKIVKKGLTLSLCAVLAGGLAAGAFEGVNRLTGWNGAASSVEASAKEEDQVKLVQTAKKSDKETENSDSKEKVTGSLDVSDIAAEAMPSVVSITTKSTQEVQELYGMFGGYSYVPQEREVEGSGSGIIIGQNDEELLIATNYHVIEDADNVTVSFIDGEVYEAKVKGFDEGRDLAVVSVAVDDISDDTMDQIKVATIGDSDNLVVGEQVVAIGNALGYGQSVTTGIVSAKNRRLNDGIQSVEDNKDNDGVNLIQTDAAINPGNSGGALLNMNGEVVGINSAKLASTEVEGMGYSIAITDVSDILENLMNETPRDKIEDGNHGVLEIKGRTVSEEGIQIYGMPKGVFVAEVTEDGAADEAGIKKNYIITEFNGKMVSTIEQLISMLEYYEPGEEVELTVEIPDSEGYKEKTVTVTLSENPDAEKEQKEDQKQDQDEDQNSEEGENLLEDWENNAEKDQMANWFFQNFMR